MTNPHKASPEQLRSFVDRIEVTNAHIADHQEARKEIFAEAKSAGYDGPTLTKLIAMRKKSPDDLAEEEAILDMYKTALGMA